MDDLETITPPVRHVAIRGETIELGPLRLEQLSPFITASRGIIGRVAFAAGLLGDAEPVAVGAMILDLLEQDSLAFAKAMAIVTGREPEWIAGGTLDEVANLVEAVVALNRDFFARRLPALLQAARPAAAAARPGPPARPEPEPEPVEPLADGQISSSTSSSTATTAATS